jgi:hypothetical protein
MRRWSAVMLFGSGLYLICYALPPSKMLLAPLYALTLTGIGICCLWISRRLWRGNATGTY